MRYFSVLSSGLLALPFAAATIHQVTVGSSAGALEFNPEAIVRSLRMLPNRKNFNNFL